MWKTKDRTFTIIFTSLYLISMTSLGAFGAFDLLKVPEMHPQFADLRLITSSSECSAISNWSISGPTCDPWNRPYNYPSLWVKIFSVFGISQKHTVILGTIEIAILALLICYWLYFGLKFSQQKNPRNFLTILVFIFSISPPVLLLMERGNVDTLMFAGITLAVYLKNQNYTKLSISVLIFLGVLKIYPAAGLVLFFHPKITIRKIIAFLSVSLLSIYTLSSDLKYIAERSETTWNTVSYGVSMVPLGAFHFLGKDESKSIALISGYALFAAVSLFFRLHSAKLIFKLRFSLSSNLIVWNTFGIFSGVFLATFLMGTSFDYRMILLLPIFVSLVASSVSINESLLVICFMLIPMLGGHYTPAIGSSGIFINYLSDILILIGSAFLLNILIPFSKKRVKTIVKSNV